VAIQDPAPNTTTDRRTSTSVNEVVDLVKDYARQETLAPLRGAGRWLGFGLLGAALLGLGSGLLILGVLRLMQNEFGDTFSGRWVSVLPYLIALVLCVAVIVVAVSRIGKSSLHKE
jgi:hypothetical protein